MQTIKTRVDELMGRNAGDGCGPTEAAAIINAEFGTEYSPRNVWNIWIDGDPQPLFETGEVPAVSWYQSR